MLHEKAEKKKFHIYSSHHFPLFWMLVSTVLLILCIAEAYVIYQNHHSYIVMGNGDYFYKNPNSMMNKSDNMRSQQSMTVKKGQDFTSSHLFSKVYQIFPVLVATQSANEKEALNGWTVKTTSQIDGSTQVDLILTESEDVRQSFVVKPGYKLYFIEMNLMDDKNGIDENRGEDVGVLVDQNGIVQ